MSEEVIPSTSGPNHSDSQTSSSNNVNGAVADSNETVESILKILRDDFSGADFLVSLFWAAMSSFRHDSILRPFPSDYIEGHRLERSEGSREMEGEKDIEGLVCVQVLIFF